MFLTKILLRIYILSIFPITAASADSSSCGFVALLNNSEIPITNSDSFLSLFADLNDEDCDQVVEHTFNMPQQKPEKRKHNPEISSECQFPKRRRTEKKKLQDSFLGENTVGYLGEFRHELTNAFLNAKKFFSYKSYNIYLSLNRSVFIREFCSEEQLWIIDSDAFLPKLEERVRENFEKLEIYAKRIAAEYVEIFRHKSEGHSKLNSNSCRDLNKILDPARTKGFYYLLIYSLYETGLIGVPRCMAAVEKIFINIITYTRLMAYVYNNKVKEEIKPKKLCPSRFVPSKASKTEQSSYYRCNFIYTDFIKPLKGKSFKKHDLFRKNADLMKKEINDNIQLIINEEFGDNPAYKRLCEDYNSKTLEFNRSILFERFLFKVGKHVADSYSYEDLDYNCFINDNGYPKNILSCLMDTDTKNQIQNLADIKLKSVFILIFISKICLCNVTDLCTLPEYVILIGSLQEAYNKHKAGPGTTIADLQSLTSYLFSLHYLDKAQVANRRERAKEVIQNVFPEYNVIFPNFDYKIAKLKDE